MDFAAIQDWMCEPHIIKLTGLSVLEHQRRTVANYISLLNKAPEIPWLPVVQGFTLDEYLQHITMYAREGVPLDGLRVGVGSVCRRQSVRGPEGIDGIVPVFELLDSMKCRTHAFGLKKTGIPILKNHIYSADSLAWSFQARRRPPLEGCVGHKNCANCKQYAMKWLSEVMEVIC